MSHLSPQVRGGFDDRLSHETRVGIPGRKPTLSPPIDYSERGVIVMVDEHSEAKHSAENEPVRCPGCGHACCPDKRGWAALDCEGDSDAVRACDEKSRASTYSDAECVLTGAAGIGNLGQPTDENLRAYLEGEHGPPSDEALQIIQAELEYTLRNPPDSAASE